MEQSIHDRKAVGLTTIDCCLYFNSIVGIVSANLRFVYLFT